MNGRKSVTLTVCWISLVLACASCSSQRPKATVPPAEAAAVPGEGAAQPAEAAASSGEHWAPSGESGGAPGEAAAAPGETVAPNNAMLAPSGEALALAARAAAPPVDAVAAPARGATYAAYLFTYFTGEGLAQGEQIYFALSRGNDPLNWDELNAGQPVLTNTLGTGGARDPFLIRSADGSRFYLIATDLKMHGGGDWDRAQRQGSKSIVVWESTDLVAWSDPRLVRVAPDTAGNTWAPEAFYDPSRGAYVVFWASTLYARNDPTHAGATYNRMLYATTGDFRTFSEPSVWYDPGYAVIDSTIIAVAGTFYRFTKDERINGAASPCGKFLSQESSLSLTSTAWTAVAACIGRGAVKRGEGPLVFKSNIADKWYLFIDEFGGRGYVPFESTDVSRARWTIAPQYSLPTTPRHGTVLPVTTDEYQRLLRAFATN